MNGWSSHLCLYKYCDYLILPRESLCMLVSKDCLEPCMSLTKLVSASRLRDLLHSPLNPLDIRNSQQALLPSAA